MHARDATGRQVSLLNEDSSAFRATRPSVSRPVSYQTHSYYSRSSSSSPNMPELLRSDSYDSHASNDPTSPMTPAVDYGYATSTSSVYGITQEYGVDGQPKRPSYGETSRSISYADDESSSATSPLPDRPGKRYPCRYRESHGCEKTFTTSGHASRHSKIHTAEKAVQCTFAGCQKKFTRADNMKQHLETHFKDKSRATGTQRTHKAALADARRHSSSGRSRSTPRDPAAQWETEQYALPTPPLASPGGTSGAWDMRGLNLPLLNRPAPSRTPSSGLDALAMAVACQEVGRV